MVHVQTNTINLRIMPYKCFVTQKFSISFTDIPYKAGTVNHATKDETKKITDFIRHVMHSTWLWDGKRGETEVKKRAVSC